MENLHSIIRATFDTHSHVFFVLDGEKDSFVYCNAAIKTKLGVDPMSLNANEFSFSNLLTRPNRWKLIKKEILKNGSVGQSFRSQLEFKSSKEEAGESLPCDIFAVTHEGKSYLFGMISERDKSNEENFQQQMSNLLNKNTQLLRERSYNKYIYSLIYNIQNLHDTDEILKFVCNKLVERKDNEFSIQCTGLYILKSDQVKKEIFISTDPSAANCPIQGDVEKFMRSARIGEEFRNGNGGVLFALNLFDVDVVDSVFLLQSASEDQLDNELNELKVILNSTARQISTVYLTNRLRKESIEDPLTGAFNRRYFDKNIKDEVNRAGRHNRDLSLIFLDIDFFKKVNDVYGHSQGDQCLKETVALCMESGRSSDHVYRYGGEEFVLLLPETNYEQAMIRAEKIRTLIEKSNYTNLQEPDKPLKITVSLGVTEYDDGQSIEEYINKADDSLYQAKANGRNRVVGSK